MRGVSEFQMRQCPVLCCIAFVRSCCGSSFVARVVSAPPSHSSVMASIARLTAEIHGSAKLITTQQRLGSVPERMAKLTSSLTRSLCQMISTLAEPLDSTAAATLLELLVHTPFDKTHVAEISDAIEARITVAAVTSLGPTEKQAWPKHSHSVLNYFTESDWDIFCNKGLPFNSPTKILRAVSRLVSGGFVKPSSPVCADIIAALAAAVCMETVDEVCLYQEVHKLGQSFAGVAEQQGVLDLPVIKEWPVSPLDLPESVKNAMYPDPLDQPVQKPLLGYKTIRKVTSCRNTKTEVRDKVKKGAAPSQALVPVANVARPAAQQDSTFAANMGAFFKSAQALGMSPNQIAQMGAHLFMQGDASATSKPDLCGLKFLDHRGSGRGAGMPTPLVDSPPGSGSEGTPTRDGQAPQLAPTGVPSTPAAVGAKAPDAGALPLPSADGAVEAALNDLETSGALGRRRHKGADVSAHQVVTAMEQEHQGLLAKAKATAAAAEADHAAHDNGKKRKAAAANGVGKKPAAAKGSDISTRIPKMPDEGSVAYKGGKILHASSRKGWRVWPDSASVTIERAVAFGDNKEASFKRAIALIDAYRCGQ